MLGSDELKVCSIRPIVGMRWNERVGKKLGEDGSGKLSGENKYELSGRKLVLFNAGALRAGGKTGGDFLMSGVGDLSLVGAGG